MNGPFPPWRALRPTAVLVLAVAVVAGAGCSASGEEAPTVNGIPVPADDITEQIEAFVESGQEEAEGAGEGTADAQLGAALPSNQVILEPVAAEAEERDLEITEELREQARAELEAQFSGAEPGSGQAVVAASPDDVRAELVELNAARLALAEDLTSDDVAVTEDDLRAAYEENLDQFSQACLNVILTDDAATAEALAARVEAGEPFAEVAAAESLDPATAAEGGDIGCIGPGQLVGGELDQALFSAEPGEVLEPVELQGQAVLVQVRELRQASFEEVRDQLAAQLEQGAAQAGGQALNQFLTEAVADAEVTVASRFGEWDPMLGVVPPTGPEPEGPPIDPLAPGGPPAAPPQPPPAPAPGAPPAPPPGAPPARPPAP